MGKSSQPLTNYYDVPDPGGALTVTTPDPGKPTGPRDPNPSDPDPAYCYFVRLKGPLALADDFVSIDINATGHWFGQVKRSGAMTFRMGCTRFADFRHAGNAVAEGYSIKAGGAQANNGAGTAVTLSVPTNVPYRTPSFTPLTAVVGNFSRPYPNCNYDQVASAFPITQPASWRRKLGSAVRSQAEFVEVVRPVRPRDAWVEVVLTSGVVLRVSEAIETETLRRFVDALDGRGC